MAADVIVPGLLSGTFWGIANIAWFVANQNLGFSVSFPIITSGPGFIGALWVSLRLKGLFLYTVDILYKVLYNSTSTVYNHHTDIYPLSNI